MPFQKEIQPMVVNIRNAILGLTPCSSIMQCNPPSICFANWRSNLFRIYSFSVLYPVGTILLSCLDEEVGEEAGKTSKCGASSKVRRSTGALRSTSTRLRRAAGSRVAALSEVATGTGD